MCTLILGLGILGPGSLLLGANRDESPQRPSADPDVLHSKPRVVGGRDLVSKGTWLAIREARFVTALMNRRPTPDDRRDPATLRSRGLLCLDVAASDEPVLDHALRLVKHEAYAPCTLVGVGIDGEAWALKAGAGEPEVHPVGRGWHVITHQEIDDPDEPRTRWILEDIQDRIPRTVEEAFEILKSYLRWHGEESSRGGAERPPVCLHRDVFPTVSSSIVALGVNEPQYQHSPGPPCVTEYRDMSGLLSTETFPRKLR